MTAARPRGGIAQKSDVDDRVRALRAMELRLAGAPYYRIADQLGYADESGARKAIGRMLSRKEVANCEELREVEGRRLDQLQTAHWPNALRGDTEAARLVLQIIDRRCKLLGLNAPTRVQVGPGVTDREWAEQVGELLSALGGPDAVAAAFPATAIPSPVIEGEVLDDSEPPADDAEASGPTVPTVSPLHSASGAQGHESGDVLDDLHGAAWSNL